MDKVKEYLLKVLKDNDTLIVCTSSGPDSMALTFLLSHLDIKLNLIVAHVNHNVRRQSQKEYLYVKEYCKNNNLTFEGMEIAFKFDKNFEQEARNARLAFFETLKNKYQAKYIVTAHHGDDLVETVLMRLTRGSNLSGYAGLKLLDGHFLKPLLFVTKKDLLLYCEKNNITYFIDKTNYEDFHTRNRYRHKVLPFLKKENALVHQKYMQFSNELLEYDSFVNKYILDKKLINNNSINIDDLKKESSFIQKKTIELLIKNIQKEEIFNIQNKNLTDIMKVLNSKKSNIMVDLPSNFKLVKSYNVLSINKNISSQDLCVLFEDFYEDDKFLIKKIKDIDEKSNNVIRLNKSEITLPLYLRYKRDKDVMQIKNLGHKKVKDIFIDSKLSISDRKTYPILVDSQNNILWIPGLKKSKFDKEKEEKYDIILFSERKN